MINRSIKSNGGKNMWLLAIVIVALASYLVYALINPEKF
ncbi:potassium-transporting ATPase subunit F [Massilimicrobiota sp. An142]|uniref:Potassium-transporting ATPase subunit F n=1 Tax=Massilimicrobiota timonensis TaxID=1776392 RepID=A0A1Y4T3Q7_9FIRM|nr:potassium-transporting ATPase subunit F [Massilimicrobiota sp. An80]OUQ14075.1 potassium-transporting ATPase subunit F [Massilimicrobiota sp. An142]OUQ29112.1 potassium-transporting ATPase subunit F [Massilimicrobiota sp. An134]OUQ36270.1 potassium-transporting ATPase subunit F [Massilimicrobiota timonensis]OUQ78430.1 potassium-transporting ATPase subunit F [Massilimicrobiota sp. An105]